MKKNVVLLGGSNSILVQGLQKGLRENENINFTNLALGATTSLQNLYEIIRNKNKQKIQSADLIITESNINDIGHYHCSIAIPIKILIRNIYWLYEELYFLKKRILVLILPRKFNGEHLETINNAHRYCCKKYGFNLIDMQYYYKKNNLFDFFQPFLDHQMNSVMRILGVNIASNLSLFSPSLELDFAKTNPNFIVCTPDEMYDRDMNSVLEKRCQKNSMFLEYTYRLNKENTLFFPKKYIGYKLIAFHAWNEIDDQVKSLGLHQQTLRQSSIVIKSLEKKVIKATSGIRLLHVLNNEIIVDNNTYIAFNTLNEPVTEFSGGTPPNAQGIVQLEYVDIIDFLLVNSKDDFIDDGEVEKLRNMEDIEYRNNFNFLIPPVALYKEIIEEYNNFVTAKEINNLKKNILEKEQKMKEYLERIKFLEEQACSLQNISNKIYFQKLKNAELNEQLKNKKIEYIEQKILLQKMK
ncbi:TPA: hypothetical protein SBV98_001224 [Campylobacter coli]|uniref:hypothetical protein n=1 Tax=Campylobacter coli TaxID=195 RepID=UPI001BA7A626|nr:hypothetical protein [Campylobacter coli]EJJ0057913.1 hypothetical protein [Campylobacter jejuni]EHN0249482.1 hypothetical protein [Campylobacter coli]EHN0324219.1 hypothetical protein [Campylobacter coli]EHN8519420.1 hypothetical protein [Campylobacter coli]EHO7203485.1 hypothetical protein [Campylobacter coli]